MDRQNTGNRKELNLQFSVFQTGCCVSGWVTFSIFHCQSCFKGSVPRLTVLLLVYFCSASLSPVQCSTAISQRVVVYRNELKHAAFFKQECQLFLASRPCPSNVPPSEIRVLMAGEKQWFSSTVSKAGYFWRSTWLGRLTIIHLLWLFLASIPSDFFSIWFDRRCLPHQRSVAGVNMFPLHFFVSSYTPEV